MHREQEILPLSGPLIDALPSPITPVFTEELESLIEAASIASLDNVVVSTGLAEELPILASVTTLPPTVFIIGSGKTAKYGKGLIDGMGGIFEAALAAATISVRHPHRDGLLS